MSSPGRFRKSIRLHQGAYRIPNTAVFITICTQKKACAFNDRKINQGVLDLLVGSTTHHGLELWACCLMPDHLHLVLYNPAGADIIAAIRDFKRTSSAKFSSLCWQRSFYDHFIRQDEDLKAIVDYIINNPVRKGMVERWEDYPWGFSKFHPR